MPLNTISGYGPRTGLMEGFDVTIVPSESAKVSGRLRSSHASLNLAQAGNAIREDIFATIPGQDRTASMCYRLCWAASCARMRLCPCVHG